MMELLYNVSNHTHNTITTRVNSSACLYLEFKDDKSLTFCDADAWEPRISRMTALAAFIVVSVYSCLVTSLTIYFCHVGSKLRVLYKKLRAKQKAERLEENAAETFTRAEGCKACFYQLKRTIKEFIEITKIVFLPIFGMLWNCVDGALDAYTFYQLEIGKLIDPAIQRNLDVNNAILAFAIVGATSNILTIKLWANFQDMDFVSDDKKRFSFKRYTMYIPFFFEDAAELVLEYFYIQRYVSITPPYYLYVKDIVIALLLIYNVYNYFSNERDSFGLNFIKALCSLNVILLLETIGSLCVLIAQIIRLVGQWIQFVEGVVPNSCFVVANRKLLQKPFQEHCLREFEIALVVVTGIPIVKCLLALLKFLYQEPQRIYKWKKDEENDNGEGQNTFNITQMFSVMEDISPNETGFSGLNELASKISKNMNEVVEKNFVVDEQPTGPEHLDYMDILSKEQPRDDSFQILCCNINGTRLL